MKTEHSAPDQGFQAGDYARRFLHLVPNEWTEHQRIAAPLVALEELAQAGLIERQSRPLMRPNGRICGSRISFRKIHTGNTLARRVAA